MTYNLAFSNSLMGLVISVCNEENVIFEKKNEENVSLYSSYGLYFRFNFLPFPST